MKDTVLDKPNRVNYCPHCDEELSKKHMVTEPMGGHERRYVFTCPKCGKKSESSFSRECG